jgi:hypothetical protein
MSKDQTKETATKKIVINESGRALPTTCTSTPMPAVKPPKEEGNSKK